MYAKKKELHSFVMKRTSDWIFSQELPNDVTVHVGGVSFSLHKFPLVSKCGYIKKLVLKAGDPGLSVIEIPDIPGGFEVFELAAKFCYGINFEISINNIAMLRCVAEYLEMTEDYSVGNLVNRTESYFKEVALKSLSGAISVLHQSEKLLPMAEQAKLVSRCIDAIAFLVIQESHFCTPSGIGKIYENDDSSSGSHSKPNLDWWAEELTVLGIDIFQRVIMAMIAIGFKQYELGPVLMLYAKNSLRGLEIFGKGQKKVEPKYDHQKRILLETIVSLLPREKNVMPVSFLCMLLKAAKYLETMVTFQIDLEKRIALQIDQAVLGDLLIPSYSVTGDTLFDVETVKRIMKYCLEYFQGNSTCFNASNNSDSPSLSDMDRVGSLMENYLAEISSDRNLTVYKFISLAELISQHAKTTEDSMYRSIDIYLKAHPSLSVIDKKRICSLMDCQRLSVEASAHAAQNDRLPVQTMVQVLYHEQQRLRDAVNDNLTGVESAPIPHKANVYSMDFQPPPTEYSGLKRENEDLKIELVSVRMRLKEFEKSAGTTPLSNAPTPANKLQLPRKSIISSLSKRFGWLSPFMRLDGVKTLDDKGGMKVRRDRRHSIS